MHEEVMCNFSMWSHNRDQLRELYQKAMLIDKPKHTDVVEIGHIVTIKDIDTEEANSYEIASSYLADDAADRISYLAPLAQLLLGAGKGQVVTGKIGPNNREYLIVGIQLPL